MNLLLVAISGCALVGSAGADCRPSVTRASGTHAPRHFCSGDLIFSDDFNTFDLEKWQHESTLGGGGNWEFQWYNNNRNNSFVERGRVHFRPSLTADQLGAAFLSTGTLNIQGGAPADRCTDPRWWGCSRTGTRTRILNPVKSARLRTVESFRFTYGRVEVQAKMPAGDWLWSAITLMPSHNAYGPWPASGEIRLAESRGNRHLVSRGANIGVEQVTSALHYGPYPKLDGWPKAHWTRNSPANQGYNKQFHRYKMEWTPDSIRFYVDDVEMGRVSPGNRGFWEHGKFNPRLKNPWKYGSKMAPFDQKFYFVISLAVGGVAFFPEDAVNPKRKPWSNRSPQAATDFWNGRGAWLPTWGLNSSDDADLQVDYVRVWAL